MPGRAKVLCLRFSALGDVAMTAMVVRACAAQYPQISFVMAGPERMRPLFEGPFGLPNLSYLAINKKEGLIAIFKQIKVCKPTHVIDLHSVLRTFALRTLFWLRGCPVHYVHKGRAARKRLLRRGPTSAPLKPMCARYAAVFQKMGLPVSLTWQLPQRLVWDTQSFPKLEPGARCVGIAPFAKHKGKQAPTQAMKGVAQSLYEKGYHLFLFGGGAQEQALLDTWVRDLAQPGGPVVVNTVGRLASFQEELAYMVRMHFMVTMDSANMHFASLLGVPVFSVWGATHPAAGFYGWGQASERAIQKELACRPCSIFGSKPCRFGTYECLKDLDFTPIIDYERSK